MASFKDPICEPGGGGSFRVLRTLELPRDVQLVDAQLGKDVRYVDPDVYFGVRCRATGAYVVLRRRFACVRRKFVRWVLRKLYRERLRRFFRGLRRGGCRLARRAFRAVRRRLLPDPADLIGAMLMGSVSWFGGVTRVFDAWERGGLFGASLAAVRWLGWRLVLGTGGLIEGGPWLVFAFESYRMARGAILGLCANRGWYEAVTVVRVGALMYQVALGPSYFAYATFWRPAALRTFGVVARAMAQP